MNARPILLLALASFLGSSAGADTLFQQATAPAALPGSSTTVNVPRFDSNLGALALVRVTLSVRPNGTVGLENTSAAPVDFSFGPYTPYWHSLSATFQVPGLPGSANSNGAYAPPPMLFGAYDGNTDFAGTSGASYTTVGFALAGTSSTIAYLPSSAFDTEFVGAGSVGVLVDPLFLNTYWEGGGSGPAGVVTQSSVWSADLVVQIQYDYLPHPTSLCAPISPVTSACPCGNTGAFGAGCANSVDANGALLTTTGTASLANDTVTLTGTRMTNSNALYFQGTNFLTAPMAYGDGLRCVVGSVVRLGTRTNVGGSSAVPPVGAPALSVTGGVASPGTRYYQVIYRDNGAFCTTSNFNAANGVSVVWAL